MLKAAIEKIVALAGPKTYEKEGHIFSDVDLYEVKPKKDHTTAITVSGLDSICKLVEHESHKLNRPIFVRVDSEVRVSVFTTLDSEFDREALYKCEADTPRITTDRFMEKEKAIIELQSLYKRNEGSSYLLNLLSSITLDSKVTSTDNGVSQKVTVNSGVQLKSSETIRPIVNLQPYRTFLEVEQPASDFLVRVNDDGEIAFIPADGGAWKLAATRNIAAYFESALADMIQTGEVVVIR